MSGHRKRNLPFGSLSSLDPHAHVSKFGDQRRSISRSVWHKRHGRAELEANEYQSLTTVTLDPALDKRDVLINSVMGLCGEAGEAIDIVKKWMAHGHELDKDHLAKELGDIAWYLAEAATALDLSLEDILRANIEKLQKRYPQGFDTERSQIRLQGDL